MKKLFGYNVKLFIKSRLLLVSIFLLLCICAGYFVAMFNVWGTEWDYNYLTFSMRISIIGFIFFAFISYEYIGKMKRYDLEETIFVIKNGKKNVYLQQLLFLMIPIFLYSIVIAGFDIGLYYYYDINFIPYLIHIIKVVLVNITFVAMIGAIIGTLLAQKFSRITSYLIIILITYLISPLFENVVDLSNANLYPYWDIFRMLPPDLTWLSDYIYGCPIEIYRWNLACFWIGLLGAILLLNISNKKNYIMRSICGILVVFTVINFIGYLSVYNDSTVRRDLRRIEGTIADDFYYTGLNGAVKNEPPDFTILSYDMDLNINRRLVASVDMVIKTVKEKQSYNFTLYRGYSIKSIEDGNEKELNYNRNGDYFEISASFEEGQALIHIEYEGSGNGYYSNVQGVALLGFFPYYPMAGYLPLWDEMANEPYINTDFTEKDFSIKVDSPLSLVSNIEETDHNVFKGKSTTVSLVGGFIVESEGGEIKYTYSPINKNRIDYLGLESTLQDMKVLIGDHSDLSFKGKKIFVLADVFMANVPREVVIFLDDHIITYLLPNKIMCAEYIKSTLPTSENKDNLADALFNYIGNDTDSEEEGKEPEYADLEILKMDMKTATSQGKLNAYLYAQDEYYNLLLYKVQTLGKDYVVKMAYQYLIDETNNLSDVDFLFNLK